LGGANVEGLYAVGQFPIPYPDDRQLGLWVHRYETEFSTIASLQALNAYRSARYFLAVLRQTGANPTQAGFAHILETREAWTDPVLGGLPIEFSRSTIWAATAESSRKFGAGAGSFSPTIWSPCGRSS